MPNSEKLPITGHGGIVRCRLFCCDTMVRVLMTTFQ